MNSIPLQFLFYLFILQTIRSSCKYVSRLVEGHKCSRTCKENAPPLTCYFKFDVELFYTMSKACYKCPYNITDCFRPDCIATDGVSRLITVINRKLPGPSIQVCLEDTLIVDVSNLMVEESTSIHWHGHHQKMTPYMDGVPFITQCPIASGTVFRYQVKAIHTGTHFWHSHTGTQRADGAFGAMIIRQPKFKEIHADLYDYDLPEHVIQLIDWIHEPSMARFEAHFQGMGNNKPDTILVNGMGRFKAFPARENDIFTPIAKFNVKQSKRYRFRVINAGFLYCPIQLSVDNHTLIIISSDGSDIKPVYVESLVIYAGERWDFILNANNNISNYWFKFRGLMDCNEKFNSAFAVGVLHYTGAANILPPSTVTYKDTERDGMQMNPVNKGSGDFNSVTAAELINLKAVHDPALRETPDIFLTLSFDFYPVDNFIFHKKGLYGFSQVDPKFQRYTPQINHVSMKMPSFPPLSEPELITSSTFCNESQLTNCEKKFCHCVYKIDLPMNSVVELLLIDEGLIYESNHPFHLHGHSFRVISLEKIGNSTTVDEVKTLEKNGKIYKNLIDPPLKDTVTVPDGGFTIIRFHTTNPGYWLLHCHLDFHVEVGMAVVFRVGETKDLPPVPKNFPRCGDYYHFTQDDVVEKEFEVPVNISIDQNISDSYVHVTTNTTTTYKNIFDKLWDDTINIFTSNSCSPNSKVTCMLPIFAFTLFVIRHFL